MVRPSCRAERGQNRVQRRPRPACRGCARGLWRGDRSGRGACLPTDRGGFRCRASRARVMSRVWTTIINLLGVLGAVSLGLLGLVWSGQDPGARPEGGAQPSTLELNVLADGGRAIRDASGRLVPLRSYRRIASASTVSDALLLEFASPEQVVSFTTYSADNEWFG